MKCDKGGNEIDCDCMGCHECHPTYTCEPCGFCHNDGWEAGACWCLANDTDYDPFDT